MTCDLDNGIADSEQHFLASCCTLNTERANLRRSLRIEDQTVTLEAASLLGLTSATPTEMDNQQKEHLQQICKIIHTMYEEKLRVLDKLKEATKRIKKLKNWMSRRKLIRMLRRPGLNQ